MAVIKPTVGRVVWYQPEEGFASRFSNRGGQPCMAHVTYVCNDHVVNLDVVDHDGRHFPMKQVYLCGPSETCKPGEAEWMPYQKGQAAKTEVLEKKLDYDPAGGGNAGS